MNDKTPKLDALRGRGDGFKSAEPDFFHDLAKQIEQKTTQAPVAKYRRLLPFSLSAVAAAALLLLWWNISSADTTTQDTLANSAQSAETLLAQLSDEDILAYIDENVADFELELLAEDADTDTEWTPGE